MLFLFFVLYFIYNRGGCMKGINFKINFLIVLNSICFFFIGSIFFKFLAIVNLVIIGIIESNKYSGFSKNNNYILVAGIIDIFLTKFISGIFLISLYYDIKNSFLESNTSKKKVKKEVNPELKKLDILLKLGVGLVFIAGFIFATTGWYSLPSILKIFIFTVMGSLFIFLSKFSEKKIKIKSTVYLYWILGMSFVFLIFVTAGYSEIFGSYFSLIGKGMMFYKAFLSIIFSILSFVTYINFKKSFFLNFVYTAIVFAIIAICNYFSLSIEEILILFVPVFTVIKLVKIDNKKDIYTLSVFSDILLFVMGIIFIIYMFEYHNIIAVMGLSILFIFDLYNYLYYKKESDINSFASFISFLVLIPSFILLFDDNVVLWSLSTTILMTLFYLISLLFNNKILKTSSLIIADIVTILVFVISATGDKGWLPLVISLISLFICVICSFIEELDNYSFEVVVHPLKISMLLFGIIYLLDSYFEIANMMGYWLSSSLLFFILFYCLSKSEKLIKIYEFFSGITIVFCLLFVNLIPNLIIAVSIFVSIVLFYADVTWAKSRGRDFKIFVYILLLINVIVGIRSIEYSIVSYDSTANVSYLFSNIVSIVLFALIGTFHKNDNLKLNLALFAVIIPIILLIDSYVAVEWASIILPSIFVYYLTFIISRLLNKDDSSKNIVGYIGYSFSFLLVIFNSNYYVLAYSLILVVISLLLGYFDKTYNALFKVSVGALIVLILYQLKEFWNLIPAWLYILILGVVLIVFATYRQLKLIEKDSEKRKK